MLVFDFDGVLINSLMEIAVNGYNVVTESLHTDVNEIDGSYLKLFKTNRYLAHGPSELIVLARWCHENSVHGPDQVLTVSKFKELADAGSLPEAQSLQLWFETRNAFVEKDLESWLKLNYPFQPIWDALIKFGAENVVVLTTKNKNAVIDLSSHYGLNLPAKNIFSGEGHLSKVANFQQINKAFKADSYTFVDDSIHNLIDIAENLSSEQIQLVLASWGYVGPSDCAEAIKLGFKVFSQEDIISLLG